MNSSSDMNGLGGIAGITKEEWKVGGMNEHCLQRQDRPSLHQVG